MVAERSRLAHDLGRREPRWIKADGAAVQIFDSLTKEWTTAHEVPDLVIAFRHQHTWAYDCADGGRYSPSAA